MTTQTTTSQLAFTSTKIQVEEVRQGHAAELDAIARYRRVTNYLAAAQIYLKDNVLLEEPLKPEHIKVFEFSPGLSPEQARGGAAHVRAIWGNE